MSDLRKYINEKTLIKDEIYKQFESSVCCAICQDIIIEPVMCMNCQALYCKSCQEKMSKTSTICTNRCPNAIYEKSILAQGLLSKLKFKCENCEEIIDYDDIKKHSLTKCKNTSRLRVLSESSIEDDLEKVKSM